MQAARITALAFYLRLILRRWRVSSRASAQCLAAAAEGVERRRVWWNQWRKAVEFARRFSCARTRRCFRGLQAAVQRARQIELRAATNHSRLEQRLRHGCFTALVRFTAEVRRYKCEVLSRLIASGPVAALRYGWRRWGQVVAAARQDERNWFLALSHYFSTLTQRLWNQWRVVANWRFRAHRALGEVLAVVYVAATFHAFSIWAHQASAARGALCAARDVNLLRRALCFWVRRVRSRRVATALATQLTVRTSRHAREARFSTWVLSWVRTLKLPTGASALGRDVRNRINAAEEDLERVGAKGSTLSAEVNRLREGVQALQAEAITRHNEAQAAQRRDHSDMQRLRSLQQDLEGRRAQLATTKLQVAGFRQRLEAGPAHAGMAGEDEGASTDDLIKLAHETHDVKCSVDELHRRAAAARKELAHAKAGTGARVADTECESLRLMSAVERADEEYEALTEERTRLVELTARHITAGSTSRKALAGELASENRGLRRQLEEAEERATGLAAKLESLSSRLRELHMQKSKRDAARSRVNFAELASSRAPKPKLNAATTRRKARRRRDGNQPLPRSRSRSRSQSRSGEGKGASRARTIVDAGSSASPEQVLAAVAAVRNSAVIAEGTTRLRIARAAQKAENAATIAVSTSIASIHQANTHSLCAEAAEERLANSRQDARPPPGTDLSSMDATASTLKELLGEARVHIATQQLHEAELRHSRALQPLPPNTS